MERSEGPNGGQLRLADRHITNHQWYTKTSLHESSVFAMVAS